MLKIGDKAVFNNKIFPTHCCNGTIVKITNINEANNEIGAEVIKCSKKSSLIEGNIYTNFCEIHELESLEPKQKLTYKSFLASQNV